MFDEKDLSVWFFWVLLISVSSFFGASFGLFLFFSYVFELNSFLETVVNYGYVVGYKTSSSASSVGNALKGQ